MNFDKVYTYMIFFVLSLFISLIYLIVFYLFAFHFNNLIY
jgi:hypothetical protein